MTKFTTLFLAGLLAGALTLALAPALAQQAQPQVQQLPQTQILRLPPRLAQAAPTGPIAVAANAGWVATGVTLRKGGQVDVVVRGLWSTLPKATSVTAAARDLTTGADGYPDSAARGLLLTTANRGALIGRIGDGAPFLIGERYSAVAQADGALLVSVNDAPNEIRDNQGALSVIVRAAAPPPPTREPAPAAPPATREPPAREQPAQDVPTQTPPQTAPQTPPQTPPTTKPPQTGPTAPPAAPTGQTAPPVPEATAPAAPPEAAPPQDVAPTPTVEVAPPAPETPVTPTIPVVPLAIGAAVLAGLLLLGNLFRPRRKPGGDRERKAAVGAKVSTRIVSDGVAGQSLTITMAERRS